MYFKRLELFGFKSFAERTRLDFEPGVTAVVGPNGCGKSNISDSIKWVLGEQSVKMLRGGKMEDVIFNGTDGKEPVNFAEVFLTLSNKDRILPIEYDEVTIGRRLYRSGESEYLLNKTPVRLKDINELFMGTGIGTSAYSIIEQGMIGHILSSKAEERREVFEEASGITKYKSKRKEALRRLEDTEQNLTRINDIVLEVKRQINSTERQAKKAERYKEKYDDLKSLELKISRVELEISRKKLSEFNKDLDEQKTKESDLDSELSRLRNELSELSRNRSEIEQKRMDFKSSAMEIDSNIANSKDKTFLNKERIEELKKRRVNLELEIEKTQSSMDSQQKEVIALREKVELLEAEDLKRADTLSQKEKRLGDISKSILQAETEISTSKANVIDIALIQTKLRNQISKSSANIGTHDARLKRLNAELEAIQEEKNKLDAKLKDAQEEIGSIDKEVTLLKTEKEDISNTILNLTNSIEKLTQASKEIHKRLATNKSRLEVFEEARLKYEGFSSGVKAILGNDPSGNRQLLEGVRDVLVNLLNVKKGYELAIESALGEYLQCIVVDSMESAKKAIVYLKENSCGKTSFIHPEDFDNISGEKTPDALLKDEKVLGRAIDFLEIDSRYINIVRYLLRDIFIVKDMEDAISIANNTLSEETIFVTLSGEIIRKGFISGGNITDAETTLINRDAKIKELSDAITMLENDSQRIEEEILKDEREKSISEKRSEDINARLSEKEIFLANAKSRLTNVEENIKGINDEVSLTNLEIDEVKTEIERFKEEEALAAKELDKAEKDYHVNEEAIKRNEDLIVEYTKEKEQFLIEIAEQRTELGSVESKKEGLSNTLNILESSFKDVEFTLNSRRDELGSSIKKVEELSKETISLEGNIEVLSMSSLEKNEKLKDIEKSYLQIMEEIEKSDNIARVSEKEINGLRSNLHEADLKKAETNYSIDNLNQRIKDVYKIDLAEMEIPEDWENIEREALKNEVEEKRVKLDSMGTVNLVAIEEHTELQERYAFLTNQRDDLEKAKDSLLKAISKINKTTKDLFIETFRSIQVEFRNFFKMLFGGGDGELVLLDESNVLESGIEIVARPPGKRLQNVSLLSGGEKALTAIALIFAIFKVKPSPFCVLDEIDAPLDESNVGRFSRMLEVFTDTSQFIIITHNKKTIDIADVMYGITMQQSGISKVVSVKFHDAEKV